MKNLVRKLLKSRGLVIARDPGRATMKSAIQAIAKRQHSFSTVIDVGASDGRWSSLFMEYFPLCEYFLIEAQPFHEKALKLFCDSHPNSTFVLAVAGDVPGVIYFDASDPFGGIASHNILPNCIQVPVTTVDHEVVSRALKPPYLVKLDTHGFEVPILKGAQSTLINTEVIVMECYNFKTSAPECLLFWEMCAELSRLGFRCIDLVDPLYRPYDDSLWQMDLVFVRDSNSAFLYPVYR